MWSPNFPPQKCVHVWLNSRYELLGFQISLPTPLPYIETKWCIRKDISFSVKGEDTIGPKGRGAGSNAGVALYLDKVCQLAKQALGLTPPALELAASAWSCNVANSLRAVWQRQREQRPQTVSIRGVIFSTSKLWIPNLAFIMFPPIWFIGCNGICKHWRITVTPSFCCHFCMAAGWQTN